MRCRGGPVIADTVAVAEMPEHTLVVRIAPIVRLPIGGVGEHLRFHRRHERVLAPAGIQDSRDLVKSVKGLTQSKSETRPDLQDRKAIRYKPGKALRGLIVGGMGLEHEPGHAIESGTEFAGALGLVNHDAPVVELNSGLCHQCDHSLEGSLGSGSAEGLLMRFECGCDGFGPSYLEMIDLCHSPTGNWYLGANDVARPRGDASCRGFGDYREASGALGRHGIGQVLRLTFAAHAGVDMNFPVPRGDIGGHHRLGSRQRMLSRQAPPRIRAKVIATKDYLFTREPHLLSNTVHLVAEGSGGHARVAPLDRKS